MNDETRKNLIDILQAAEEIENFVSGMDFKIYQNKTVTKRAVERDFEIIGEALNRIKNTDNELLEKISEHHRIIGFRNILIHGYDIVVDHYIFNMIYIIQRMPGVQRENTIRHIKVVITVFI